MNLNNAIMLSLGMVRSQWAKPNFDFSQLWAACADGTMLSFQQSVLQKAAPDARPLTEEIIACLSPQIPTLSFYRDGQLDFDGLSHCLAPFWENSYGMDDQFFLPRNEASVKELCKLTNLSPAAARDCYLFLLLHLQIKPKEVIRPADLAFLLTRLQTAPTTAPVHTGPRLAILRGEPVRAMGREVQAYRGGSWQTLFRTDAPVTHLCAGDRVGILAVTADGGLAAPECPRAKDAARGKTITGADAFGSHYALLCRDGNIISSVPGLDWQEVQSVCLGLNSAAAITGPLRRLVQKNSDSGLAAFTDVQSVSTRTDGKERHYAVLRRGGQLHLSFTGEVLTGVKCAVLCPHGALYIREGGLYLRPVTGETKLLRQLPEELTVQTLTVRDNLILLGTPDTPIAVSLSRPPA